MFEAIGFVIVPRIDFLLTSALEYECVVFLFSNREVVIQHTFTSIEKHTIQYNTTVADVSAVSPSSEPGRVY